MFSVKNFIEISRQLYRNRVVAARAYKVKRELLHFPSEAAKALDREGLYIIKNYFSVEQCNAIKERIDGLWAAKGTEETKAIHDACLDTTMNKQGVMQADGYKLWIDRHYSDHRIVGAEKIHPLIEQFHSDEKCLNIGEYHLGVKLHLQFTMANKVVYRQENLGSGGGWHRDNIYSRGFKSLVYLSDVTTADGPFSYIPKSHHIFNHLFKVNKPERYQFENSEIEKLAKTQVEVTASAGSLVLFDTNILHRGKPVGEGHSRYALTNYYHYK